MVTTNSAVNVFIFIYRTESVEWWPNSMFSGGVAMPVDDAISVNLHVCKAKRWRVDVVLVKSNSHLTGQMWQSHFLWYALLSGSITHALDLTKCQINTLVSCDIINILLMWKFEMSLNVTRVNLVLHSPPVAPSPHYTFLGQLSDSKWPLCELTSHVQVMNLPVHFTEIDSSKLQSAVELEVPIVDGYMFYNSISLIICHKIGGHFKESLWRSLLQRLSVF